VSRVWLTEPSDVAMWSIIEPSVGIIAGSLPSIRPLWSLLCRRHNETGSSKTTVGSRERSADSIRKQADATSQNFRGGSRTSEPSGGNMLRRFWPLCSWRRTASQSSTANRTADMRDVESGGIWTRRSVEISTTVRRTNGPSGGLVDRTSICAIKAER
jgi:hypothetical protein